MPKGEAGHKFYVAQETFYGVKLASILTNLIKKLAQESYNLHKLSSSPVGSKYQTGLGLCREHGIVWGRMIAIGQIALANPDDGPFVAVVIEIKELHRHPACGCLPNNA
jgi:hypothetical protein